MTNGPRELLKGCGSASQSWARRPQRKPFALLPAGQRLRLFTSEAGYSAKLSMPRQSFSVLFWADNSKYCAVEATPALSKRTQSTTPAPSIIKLIAASARFYWARGTFDYHSTVFYKKLTLSGRPSSCSCATGAGLLATKRPRRQTCSRAARSRMASAVLCACSSTKSACAPATKP